MESKQLIFVYGTLCTGQNNHHLLRDANALGVGYSAESYAMYLLSGYPYVTSHAARYPIKGELFGVDDETLAVLDKMEGHPRYYVRKEIEVIVEGTSHTAWMYFKDPPGVLMPHGDFCHSSDK